MHNFSPMVHPSIKSKQLQWMKIHTMKKEEKYWKAFKLLIVLPFIPITKGAHEEIHLSLGNKNSI